MVTKMDEELLDEEPQKRLTKKEEVFVERYLVHWNGAQAAREAGYSEKSARYIAAENLTKPHISSRVRERLAEIQMSADEVHARLSDQARVDMADFLTSHDQEYPLWSPHGRYKRGDTVERFEAVYKAIAENKGNDPDTDKLAVYWQKIERRKFVDLDLSKALELGKTHLIKRAGYNKYGQLEIEVVDSQAALVHIGRKHKMFTDKTEHTEEYVIPDAEAIAAAALKRLRGGA